MVRNSRLQQLFIVVMTAILFLSQSGLFGLQTVNAANLENAVTISAVDEDGSAVLDTIAVEISNGDTAFDVIREVDDQLEWDSYDFGEMITGIGGVAADPESNFWSFYVNGLFQDMGASSTEVTNGDNIQFILTDLAAEPQVFDVAVSAVDANGETVITETTVSMPQYTTAYDALIKAAANQNVKVDVSVDSEYLTFVNYLGEPLERDCEYWSTYMNGDMMQVGLLGHTVKDGDTLELVVDDSCEPEEPADKEDEKSEEPPVNEKDKKKDKEQVVADKDYTEALQAVINYLSSNPAEMDWYGFSALHSAGADVSNDMAEEVAASINDDYSGNATEIAKNIIILTSAGYDATDINGINLIEMLLNEKMPLSNQLVYSLLAIDSFNYPTPEGTDWTRDSIIEAFLEMELDAGGWSFFGERPSPDITGMGLLALSAYADDADVKAALDRAVKAMSKQQGDKGGYDEEFNGGYSAESAAMVIIGLSAVGVDATSDAFTKSGGNLLEHLISFQMEDGSFKHLPEDDVSSVFAINQGALALVAYDQFKNGTGPVFKFDKKEDTKEPGDDEGDGDNDGNNDKNNPSDDPNKVIITKDNLHQYETEHAVVVTPHHADKLANFTVEVEAEAADYLVQADKPLVINNGDTIITIPVPVVKQLRELGETIEVNLAEQSVKEAIGAVYDFTLTVDGTIVSEFDHDIIIGLAVDADAVQGLDANQIKAFHFNEETESWDVLSGSTYDATAGFVTLTTDHLSTFGVFKHDTGQKDPADDDKDGATPPLVDNDKDKKGKKLPMTATNMFNLLALGFILIAAGALLYIKRRNKVTE